MTSSTALNKLKIRKVPKWQKKESPDGRTFFLELSQRYTQKITVKEKNTIAETRIASTTRII